MQRTGEAASEGEQFCELALPNHWFGGLWGKAEGAGVGSSRIYAAAVEDEFASRA